jgi:hypothetical protein
VAITTAICNSYKKELLDGLHQASDTYMVALYTNAATLNKNTAAYSATNEVVGIGYLAGGIALSGYASALSGDTAYIDWADPVWSLATIVARGCLVYNASQANKAVGVYDFGTDIFSSNGNFTVQLPAPGATAIVRIS